VFDNLDCQEAAAFAGPDRPQALATEMHRAWVSFAATGEPGWPVWDESRPVMIFNTPASAVAYAPREDERRAIEHVGL
jgi:para-nitrobenzyl esterase